MTFKHEGQVYTVDINEVINSEQDFADAGDALGIDIKVPGLENYCVTLWFSDDIEIIFFNNDDDKTFIVSFDDIDISVEEISKLEHFFCFDTE